MRISTAYTTNDFCVHGFSTCNYICLPNASGIELMEFGGIMPTSVTTAVILDGGVRSYNGLRISRLSDGCRVSELCGRVVGNVDTKLLEGAIQTNELETYTRGRAHQRVPSSFFVKLSSCTPSENLYVSQHTITGTECWLAIMATSAVPAREKTAPLECSECAPTMTRETSVIIAPSAGRRRYVHGIDSEAKTDRRVLP